MNTNSEQEEANEGNGIVRIEGVPKSDEEGKISRRELLSFKAICDLLGRKLEEGGQLGECYLRAKVAQEENAAKKTAEEAAEIAARRDEISANADVKRQESVSKFVDNIKSIADLPLPQQILGLAKLMEENPEVELQLQKIDSLLKVLRLTRGLVLEEESAHPALNAEKPTIG